MGKSRRKEQESKSNNFNKSYRKIPNRKQFYGRSTLVNHSELSRYGFDSHMNRRGYGAYSWPNRYASIGKPFRKKKPSRSPSPVLGSEEYMARKVQKTSAIIMQQLLNPNEPTTALVQKQTHTENRKNCTESPHEDNVRKPVEPDATKQKNKKIHTYNIEVIHKKIISHITNLNDGKKKNLINSNISGYDTIIQQIQKQKRLEISRALRDMCSQSKETQECSDFINSIIPDIGIKIEDLPRDLIEQLSNTLNYDFESGNYEKEFSSCHSLNTGHSSLGESQADKGDMLSGSISFQGEQFPTKTCIKTEVINESPSVSQSNTEANICEHELLKDLQNKRSYAETCIKSEVIDESPSVSQISTESNREKGKLNKNVHNEQAHTETDIEPEVNDKSPVTLQISTNRSVANASVKNYNLNSSENNEHYVITISDDSLDDKDVQIQNPSEIGIDLSLSSDLQEVKNHNTAVQVEDKEIEKAPTYIEETQSSVDSILREKPNENCISSSTLQNLNVSTQTEEKIYTAEEFVELFLANSFKEPAEDITEAIKRMIKIDNCILRLTNYRQTLFNNFARIEMQKEILPADAQRIGNKKKIGKNKIKKTSSNQPEGTVNKTILKRKANKLSDGNSNKKARSEVVIDNKNETTSKAYNSISIDNEDIHSLDVEIICNKVNQQNLLEFQDLQEKMLVIKVIEGILVAATESGKIFFFSLEDGHCTNVLEVSKVPVTSLFFIKISQEVIQMYIGSFENNLKIYNFCNRQLQKSVKIEDSIQCIESNWGYIFMGCIRGTILRYSLKKEMLEYEDKFSDNGILVLKATQEGARRILLIGSRNSPICIRDAMTGLYMRKMDNVISPTVYSLVIEKNLIYCGTTNHDILVFSFHDGKLIHTYKATNSKGVGCIKIVKNLLFASCHNGNVYVYDINKNIFIDSLEGPGGVILSMEVLENQVIVGTMSFKFKSVPIPQHILRLKQQ